MSGEINKLGNMLSAYRSFLAKVDSKLPSRADKAAVIESLDPAKEKAKQLQTDAFHFDPKNTCGTKP